jgi:hypothetical protein
VCGVTTGSTVWLKPNHQNFDFGRSKWSLCCPLLLGDHSEDTSIYVVELRRVFQTCAGLPHGCRVGDRQCLQRYGTVIGTVSVISPSCRLCASTLLELWFGGSRAGSSAGISKNQQSEDWMQGAQPRSTMVAESEMRPLTAAVGIVIRKTVPWTKETMGTGKNSVLVP